MKDNFKFEEINREDYESFINETNSQHFMQQPEFFDVLNAKGDQTFIVALKENGKIKVASTIRFDRTKFGKVLVINAGPVFLNKNDEYYRNFYEGLEKFAKDQGNILYISVTPNSFENTLNDKGDVLSTYSYDNDILKNLNFKKQKIQIGWEKLLNVGLPYHQYIKKLTNDNGTFLTYEELKKSYTKHTKRFLNRATRNGVKIRKVSGREELPLFKEIMDDTATRLGFPVRPIEYYQRYFDGFKEKADFLIGEIDFNVQIDNLEKDLSKANKRKEKLEKNNEDTTKITDDISLIQKKINEARDIVDEEGKSVVPVSVALFFTTPESVTFFIGGNLDKYQKFDASYSMQDFAMNKSLENKIPVYNFYGISGEFNGNDGVLKFKESFNGEIKRTNGYFYKPVKKLKYNLYKALKSIKG